MKRFGLFTLAVVCALAGAPACFGQTSAATHLGGGNFTTAFVASGYFFTPNQNLLVTHLGFFDANQDGLANTHDVGIFLASNAALVANTVIQSGVASPLLDGQSRYEPIAPVVLTAGTQYYAVANNYNVDELVFGTGSVGYAAQITWNGFGDANTNSIFSTTTNFGGVPGNLGPNFIFSAVPEPTTMALCGLALAGSGYGFWRRRQFNSKVAEASQQYAK